MPLSPYHQKYIDQADKEIADKATEKMNELQAVFDQVRLKTDSDPAQIAVLGCGDKRLIAHHRRIFAEILHKPVAITTFDITVDHLAGETGVIRHDCTRPLPCPNREKFEKGQPEEGQVATCPYDIVYSHVLLKFIETGKQWDVIMNSYDALKPGGLAIHVLDRDEIDAPPAEFTSESSENNPVPLTMFTEWLEEKNIKYHKIPVKYGVALVMLK